MASRLTYCKRGVERGPAIGFVPLNEPNLCLRLRVRPRLASDTDTIRDT